MATVTINQLMCEQMYTIIAGGITDNDLIGPQFQREVVSAPACPIPPTPTPTPIGKACILKFELESKVYVYTYVCTYTCMYYENLCKYLLTCVCTIY